MEETLHSRDNGVVSLTVEPWWLLYYLGILGGYNPKMRTVKGDSRDSPYSKRDQYCSHNIPIFFRKSYGSGMGIVRIRGPIIGGSLKIPLSLC